MKLYCEQEGKTCTDKPQYYLKVLKVNNISLQSHVLLGNFGSWHLYGSNLTPTTHQTMLIPSWKQGSNPPNSLEVLLLAFLAYSAFKQNQSSGNFCLELASIVNIFCLFFDE